MGSLGFLLVVCAFFQGSVEARVHRYNACDGVVYSGLGCFDLRHPFINTNWLPQSPDFVGTNFQLFTRQNPVTGQELVADHREMIRNSYFDGSKPTKILVHGFLQNPTMPFLINTTHALLEYYDMNVVVVGWSGGAGFPYGQAAANTRLVGAQLARLVAVLMQVTNLTPGRVHIIGHSLGAHVAGYTGARISGIGRITALDPAQPNFHGFARAVRLDTTDANFVDVIHTDGIPYNTVGGYGLIEPIGHVDFYPNGGHHQPGCQDETSIFGLVEDTFTNGITRVESHISCSHERSVQLFAASIDFHAPCTFRAFECESEQKFQRGECTHCGIRPCPMMGFHADMFPASGVYYLNTTSTEPFCGHHYFISATIDQSMAYTVGTLSVQLIGTDASTEWIELKSGVINSGETISRMVLSDVNTGSVVRVKVKFTYTGSMFSWWSDSNLRLSRVKVTNLRRAHPKFFCQPNMLVEHNQELTLSTNSFIETDCSY